MKNNPIEEKSFAFAVRAVRLHKYLVDEKHEQILSKQFLRSGTSLGANVAEAVRGQSRADFASKMSIALKEANETEYWIRLLRASEYLNDTQFASLHRDVNELIALLVSICKTANRNK